MMNDEFISSAWRKPPPDFARQLRERLRALDGRRTFKVAQRTGLRAAACAAALLLAASLLSLPAVRAGARAFLDLFRVVSFAAVPVQKTHIEALLSDKGLDLPRMLGEQVHVEKEPGPLQPVATPAQAAALAGITLRVPTWQPPGLEVQEVAVSGAGQFSVTASAGKLKRLLASQGIDDLTVPDGIDGQTATISIPSALRITYSSPAGRVVLVEARRPEASLPAGLDLPKIAEVGLRLLGVDRSEAYRIAQNVDWHTTLVVPVPTDVAVFRQVDIQGNTGLLIQSAPGGGRERTQPQSQLLWSSGGQVFALIGDLRSEELFEMAQSTH